MRLQRIFACVAKCLTAILLLLPLVNSKRATGAEFQSQYLKDNNTAWVDTPIARFHYMKVGKGPPVVLIPGGGQWLYTYRRTIPILAKYFTVYAVDLPGQGYTELKQGDFEFDFPAMSSALEAFLDALKLGRASLVGHSWGGSWSLDFAAHHPERIDKLVLIGAPAFEQTNVWDWWPLGVPLVGELMTDFMRRSDLERMLRKSFTHKELVTSSAVNENWAPLTRDDNREALRKWQSRLEFTNMPAVIARVQSETLVLWGADDYFDAPWQASELGRQLSRATVQVFPGCGHSLHEDCSDDFNAALLTFLAPPKQSARTKSSQSKPANTKSATAKPPSSKQVPQMPTQQTRRETPEQGRKDPPARSN